MPSFVVSLKIVHLPPQKSSIPLRTVVKLHPALSQPPRLFLETEAIPAGLLALLLIDLVQLPGAALEKELSDLLGDWALGLEEVSFINVSWLHVFQLQSLVSKGRECSTILSLILQIMPCSFAPSTALLGLLCLLEKTMVTEMVATCRLVMHLQTGIR